MKAQDAENTACEHCGALVFPETKRCPQCGQFPVRLHLCPKCKTVGPGDAEHCPECGRMYEPGGDYL
jgi:RNA polymerase subunit RPABC4/transcription elongation factor Spt4